MRTKIVKEKLSWKLRIDHQVYVLFPLHRVFIDLNKDRIFLQQN